MKIYKEFLILIFSFLVLSSLRGQIKQKLLLGYLYGVNGHPLNSYDYHKLGIINQMKLIKQLNLRAYRFDVDLNTEGIPTSKLYMDSLYIYSQKYGIELLPMIYTNKNNDESSYVNNEWLAHKMMLNFLKLYPAIKYIELGNEMDANHDSSVFVNNKININSKGYKRFYIHIAVLNGYIRAIREFNPNIKSLIGYQGPSTWYIKAVSKAGINFDIISAHPYTDESGWQKSGDISKLNQLSKDFNNTKPIWITEFNYDAEKILSIPKIKIHQTLNQGIHDIKLFNNVKALFFYELIDEPNNPSKFQYEKKLGISNIIGRK